MVTTQHSSATTMEKTSGVTTPEPDTITVEEDETTVKTNADGSQTPPTMYTGQQVSTLGESYKLTIYLFTPTPTPQMNFILYDL